jgi:hypothetical protein
VSIKIVSQVPTIRSLNHAIGFRKDYECSSISSNHAVGERYYSGICDYKEAKSEGGGKREALKSYGRKTSWIGTMHLSFCVWVGSGGIAYLIKIAMRSSLDNGRIRAVAPS